MPVCRYMTFGLPSIQENAPERRFVGFCKNVGDLASFLVFRDGICNLLYRSALQFFSVAFDYFLEPREGILFKAFPCAGAVIVFVHIDKAITFFEFACGEGD